jgi:hypothetical protein
LFTYYGVNFHLVGLHLMLHGEAHSLSWFGILRNDFCNRGDYMYPKYKKYYKQIRYLYKQLRLDLFNTIYKPNIIQWQKRFFFNKIDQIVC